MTTTLSWLVTLLLVHLVATVGCFALYRGAPCWLQKLAVIGIGIANAIFTLAYLVAIAHFARNDVGWHAGFEIGLLAFAIEHLAVLLMVFRLSYQGWTWKHSSARSLSSQT